MRNGPALVSGGTSDLFVPALVRGPPPRSGRIWISAVSLGSETAAFVANKILLEMLRKSVFNYGGGFYVA